MRKTLFTICFIVLLLYAPAHSIPVKVVRDVRDLMGAFTGPRAGTAQDDNIKASLDLLHAKVSNGGGGTGLTFYVDSTIGGSTGTSWADALGTLDEAVILCTDNNNDRILVAPGHAEDWSTTDSADLDIIGITVIGLGTGTDAPTFTYTDTDGELVIAAANVKIYNLRFLPSVSQIEHAIEIEEDADGSIIDSCVFLDGETPATDEFIDAIKPASGADDIIISNCIATEVLSVSVDVANTWLDLTAGVIDNISVYNNRVRGHYAEAGIFSDDIDTLQYVAYNIVTNICGGAFAIEYSTTASGTMIYNYCAADTPGSIIDPGSMENSMNVEADYNAAEDAEAGPAWATGKATASTANFPDNVEPDSLFAMIMCAGTTATATTYDNTLHSLEAIAEYITAGTGVTTAIDLEHLDKLIGTADGTDNAWPTSVASHSILAYLMSDDADPVTTHYDNTTMSLEALNVDLDAILVDVGLWNTAGKAQTILYGSVTAGATAAKQDTAQTDLSILTGLSGANLLTATQNSIDAIEADTAAWDTATKAKTLLYGSDTPGATAADTAAISVTGVTGAPTANTLADTLHKSGGYSYDNQTDSLEAISDKITALGATGLRGTATDNSVATTVICPDLSGYTDDYFNTGWSLIVLKDQAGGAADPEGKIVDIVNYVSSTGTFTVLTTTTAVTTGDKIYVRRTEDLELDIPTTLGSAGTIRYVDSERTTSDGTGLTWENAHLTITDANDDCDAGDVVYIADGHNEAIGSLILGRANTSFIGLGEGNARPILDYDAATDEITISAAGITLKNVRLIPGYDSVTAGIVLGAAGIGCTLENISFIEGEGAGEEFEDCIILNALSANTTIRNCTAINATATSGEPDTFVNLTGTTIDDCSIIDCYVYGTFNDGIVWWDSAIPVNLIVKGNTFTNTQSGKSGIIGTGAATGTMSYNLVSTNAIGNSYDPGQMTDFENYWDDFDTHDKAAVLWTTNEDGVDRFSASELAQIKAQVVSAVETDYLLDKLLSADDTGSTEAYPTSVVSESLFSFLMTVGATPNINTFDNTTDSLEAIADHVQTLATTGAGSAVYPSGIANESIVAYILSKSETPAASSYSNELHSLEMISDIIGVYTGDEGANDDDSVKSDLDLAQADLTLLTAAAAPSFGHTNYLAVATGTFDGSGTWSTVAAHEIAVVTGCVRMTIIAECKTSVSSNGDGGAFQLGDETVTDSIIATSALGSGVMVTGELWADATLTRTILTRTLINGMEIVVCNGKDIGYEVTGATLTSGSMVFHIYWTKMDSSGAVAAGEGGPFS